MKKKVYVSLSADILHSGHINILKRASKLGDVTVGLMTDKAISEYKKIPLLNYTQRKIVVQNLSMVKNVIPQDTKDYRPNLKKLKPNYVVHGDDWKNGVLKESRDQVIEELKKWSGKLIEFKYTENISSTKIKKDVFKYLFNLITCSNRDSRFCYNNFLAFCGIKDFFNRFINVR